MKYTTIPIKVTKWPLSRYDTIRRKYQNEAKTFFCLRIWRFHRKWFRMNYCSLIRFVLQGEAIRESFFLPFLSNAETEFAPKFTRDSWIFQRDAAPTRVGAPLLSCCRAFALADSAAKIATSGTASDHFKRPKRYMPNGAISGCVRGGPIIFWAKAIWVSGDILPCR